MRIVNAVALERLGHAPGAARSRRRPELKKQYDVWKESRTEFVGRLAAGDPAAVKQVWQRYCFHGELPEAGSKAPNHEHKLRLHRPVDRRKR